ncbi:thioredoxin-disulfide reductase [Patescibacteria group bacterium]|nr:thioredoxin-disulfide reductase [Patescibacteria group bacterium]
MRDVIIIGAGPAGYTAGIYLARAGLKPLILAGEQAGGQLMWTTEVENYPGFSSGIMGPKLMEDMRAQAEKFGAEIENKDVTKIDFQEEVKKVWVNEKEYVAKVVIVSTGARARMLGVGEEKLLGRGASTCAVCDAAFFKDKVTYVVGGGDTAMEEVMALKRQSKSVGLIYRGDKLRASKIMQDKALSGVEVTWNSEVVGVVGEQKLEKIKVKDVKTGEEKELLADGLFLAIGHLPETSLFEGQLELDENGYLVTGKTDLPTQTSLRGVFGAGDVVDFRYKQAVTAAGMGCMAALDVEKYLSQIT